MKTRTPTTVTIAALLLALSSGLATIGPGIVTADAATVADKDSRCNEWAQMGECDKNPGYMLQSCATSCQKVADQALKDDKELASIQSFFDMSVNDIYGNEIDLNRYKGQVTVLVNVASQCGYTDSHYKGLVQLWETHLKQLQQTVHLLGVPCNQFGSQEPGGPQQIMDFVTSHYGVTFTMLEKMNVNGPDAATLYKFLKRQAGPTHIAWNFATYYIVGPDGTVESHSGVEPLDLKDRILELASGSEEEL